MMTNAYNPWDVVNNPPEPTLSIYGQVKISAWACMLVAGMGKVPYDDKVLTPEGEPYRRNTAVDLTITPLAEGKNQYDTKRSMLAEFGEWKDITWPSIKALGTMNAQEIDGRWCRAELVATGRKYTNQAGEEREAKAIKFTAFYPDHDTCLLAYFDEHSRANMNGNGNANGYAAPSAPAPQAAQAQPAAASNGNGANKEQETAIAFARAFVGNAVRTAGKDIVKARELLAPMLASQPLISKYYTIDSPEIMQMIAEAAA